MSKSSENPSGQMARWKVTNILRCCALPTLCTVAEQPRALRHQKLLVIVGVVVGRQHDQDRPAESAVDVVGDDSLKHRALEDAIEAALIGVEVVGSHRIGLLPSAFACSADAALRDAALPAASAAASASEAAAAVGVETAVARMLKVNRHGVAVDGVLLLLLLGKLASAWPRPAPARHSRYAAARWDCRRRSRARCAAVIGGAPAASGPGTPCACLKLLHRCGQLLLALPLLGIPLRLQLLLRLEARYLLGIGRCRAHGQRAGRRSLLVAAQQAGKVGDADERDDDDQRDDDRHTLPQRAASPPAARERWRAGSRFGSGMATSLPPCGETRPSACRWRDSRCPAPSGRCKGRSLKSKLMSEGLLVLHLVERGRFLELAAQIGELVVAPYLLQAKLLALRLVPGVVKVQRAGILAAVLLRLSSARL